jgi:hypothetical protein
MPMQLDTVACYDAVALSIAGAYTIMARFDNGRRGESVYASAMRTMHRIASYDSTL